jgi:hypothetical protein
VKRRGDEVVGHYGILGLGEQFPMTRRDVRRKRVLKAVPGLRLLVAWLHCSVPLMRGRFDGWLHPYHRYLTDTGAGTQNEEAD